MRGRKGVLYNLSMLTVGQVVSQLANLAALIFLGDYLGAHWFGVVQVGVAFMAYALITAEWGMMSLGIREISRLDDPDAIFTYARQHTGLLAVQAVVVLGIGLVILPRLPFYHHAPPVFILYLATVLPQIYTQNWIAVGLERMVPVGISRIVRSLSYALLVIVGLRLLDGVAGQPAAHWVPAFLLVAMVASNLVVNWPLARWFGRWVHPAPCGRAEAGRRWRETRSIGANIIIQRLLYNVDILLLGSLAAPAVAGTYAAASRIIFLLVVAVEVLWAALLPRLSRLARESRGEFRRSFNLYLGFVVAILLPTAIGGYLVGPDLIEFAYRGKFPEAGPVFQVLSVSYSMLAVSLFLGNTLLSDDRQREYFWPLVAVSAVAVLGVWILAPTHLARGASWAMASAHGTLLVVLLVLTRREFRPEFGWLLVRLTPALAALVLALGFLGQTSVLVRVGGAGVLYLAGAFWPLREFRRRLCP